MLIEDCARELARVLESRYPVSVGEPVIEKNDQTSLATVTVEGVLCVDEVYVSVRVPREGRLHWTVEVGYRRKCQGSVDTHSFPRHVIARDLPSGFRLSFQDVLKELEAP